MTARDNSIRLILAVLIGLVSTDAIGEAPHPVPVEIVQNAEGYLLLRGGEPYVINGAGTQEISALKSVRAHGGNSVRTWSTDNVAELLDEAWRLDITVALCLNVMRERHGFDYNDEAQVQAQFEQMKQEVIRYKDHPALLAWIIGNELNHDFKNPRVYDAVNDISLMIHELDPHHPTTTATAGISRSLLQTITERAADLDFLSVQVYGGIKTLRADIGKFGYKKPLMVTEWGTVGHWEVDSTAWAAPLELDSTRKAAAVTEAYDQVIKPMKGQVIGNYIFLWGQKQERTPTWYGLFTPDGGRTESVDVMQYIWTGSWPNNRAPVIEGLRLNGELVQAGMELKTNEEFAAEVLIHDLDGDTLSYRWHLLEESTATQSGGDKEAVPLDVSSFIEDRSARSTQVIAPMKPGAYRLFVYIIDSEGGAAHVNVPVHITS